MTQITFQDGKIVLRDGKVGTGQGCCCGEEVRDCLVTVNVAWLGVQVGLNECARCGEYPGDFNSTLSATSSLRDTLQGIFESRGFIVHAVSDLSCMTMELPGYDPGYPPPPGCDFPCDAVWCGELFGGFCLDCEGSIEEDFTLDPLPTLAFDSNGFENEAFAYSFPDNVDFIACNPLP